MKIGSANLKVAVGDGSPCVVKCPLSEWAGAGREKPGWHLDHDLLANIECGDGVVDQLADDRSGAVVRRTCSFGGGFLESSIASSMSTTANEVDVGVPLAASCPCLYAGVQQQLVFASRVSSRQLK